MVYRLCVVYIDRYHPAGNPADWRVQHAEQNFSECNYPDEGLSGPYPGRG